MTTALQVNDAQRDAWTIVGRLVEADGGQPGTVTVDLIAEGFGNRADNHYYPGDLLERAAPKFRGAKMYSNHLTKTARDSLGGLPRSWEDIVGRIQEAWVTRNTEGRRVIRARAQVFNDQLRRLLEQAIDVVGVSINAKGLSRLGEAEGRQAKVVEDIRHVDSVDVVSEAGAGGRFLALVEAAAEEALDIEQEADEVHDDDQDPARDERQPAQPDDAARDAEANDRDDDPAGNGSEESEAREADGAWERNQERMRRGEIKPRRRQRRDDRADEEPVEEAAAHRLAPRAGGRFSVGGPDQRLGGEPRRGAEWRDEFELTAEQRRGGAVATPNHDFYLEHEDTGRAPSAQDIEAMIEHRARGIAAERLHDAVREALNVAREDFDSELAEALEEADRDHQRELARVHQRHVGAGLIEGTDLPAASKRALREACHDLVFDDEDGTSGEDRLREAVTTRIDAKWEELGELHGARTTGAGRSHAAPADLTEAHRGGRERLGSPRTAPTDETIDRELAA